MNDAETKQHDVHQVNLADLWDDDIDEHAEWLCNKREDAALTLTGMLHHAGISRAELARQLGWKPSRVTRALTGNENLTLNTLAEIIGAGGLDYDILVRPRGACRALQPWERARLDAEILDLHTQLTAALGEVKDMHRHATANLAAAQEINRAMFRRANAMKRAMEGKKAVPPISTQNLTYCEEDDAPSARAA